MDYRATYPYFEDVHEALDAVAELVDADLPGVAAELAEYALDLLESATGMLDDSRSGLGGAMSRAQEIHLNACAASPPNPTALAEMLVKRALTSDYEVFRTVLPDYEPILGPAGLARYQELVEQAWQALPSKKRYGYDRRRSAITYLMEQLAELTEPVRSSMDLPSH